MKRFLIALLINLLIFSLGFAATSTPNLSLTKPDRGDSGWHTSLNSNFDKLDTGYGNNVSTIADLPQMYIETGTFNSTTGDTITLPVEVGATNEYSVEITPTSRAGAIGDIYVTKTTTNFVVKCVEANTTDTFEAVIYYLGDIASYGGSIYRRWYVSPDAAITDHGDDTDSGSFAWVLAQIGATPATVELPGNKTYTITTATSVPITIKVVPQMGAVFDGAGTLTFDNSGQIDAAENQTIFGNTMSAASGVTFTNGGTVQADWWEIDGVSDEVQFQAANDSIAASGGVVALVENTYLLRAPNTITLAGGTKYYAVNPSSGVNWIGKGYNTVVKLDDSQTAGGNDPGLFVTNTAYQNVTFEKIRFDLNGDNNAIASDLNVPAIWVSGDSAYAKNIRVENCWFEENPGLNVIIFGQSNSTGATLGEDILIAHCRFYNNGTDTSITDHTSIYTWANNVRIIGNYFENPVANTTCWSIGCAWEFHGSGCVATANTVKRYGRGCYVGANYVSTADGQIINANKFEWITRNAVNIWCANANAKALVNVAVTNNIINLYDMNVAGNAKALEILFGADTSVNVENIIFSNNTVTKSGGTDIVVYGVTAEPQNSRTLNCLKISGNIFSGIYQGIRLASTSGAITAVTIEDNIFKNFLNGANTTPSGIYTTGAGGLDTLKIHNNHFVENNSAGEFDFGILLSGTLTDLEMSGNTYDGIVTNNYLESSLTYTTKKMNGEWVFDVAAAATGSQDTFFIVITLNTTIARTGFVMDLIGNFEANENIYKRFSATGYLSSNTMADGESAEVITIGDALKTAITAGNPVAVGSGNRISITFTNTDDGAFTGILSLTGLTDIVNQIKYVTVSNYQ